MLDPKNSTFQQELPPDASIPIQAPTHVRHVVLTLTILSYMITYMDRVVISAAVPSIQKEFGFSVVTMGWILSSFQWAYALFQIPGGWLGDRLGPRRALTIIVVWWSIFTSATTLAWSAVSMGAIRFLFGMGEAGSFPIATRALSRWVLATERGFAQGITHAGSRLGGAMTPAIVAIVITRYGWRAAFLLFGSFGLIWSVAWFCYYRDSPREHKSVNSEELKLIQSSVGDSRRPIGAVPWRKILQSRQMWVICAMYFCYGYNLGVYLTWFPKYLNDSRGFNLRDMGIYASLTLLAGVAGDILGGWGSDFWARRSGDLRTARRSVGCFGFFVCAVAILLSCYAQNPYTSVWCSCLAMFSLELTVGVSWAVTLDVGREFAGSVSALMNTCGNTGGAIASALSAYLLTMSGWHAPFLVMSALAFLAAALYLPINASKRLIAA